LFSVRTKDEAELTSRILVSIFHNTHRLSQTLTDTKAIVHNDLTPHKDETCYRISSEFSN